jgi:hypothetical protein
MTWTSHRQLRPPQYVTQLYIRLVNRKFTLTLQGWPHMQPSPPPYTLPLPLRDLLP